MATRTLDVIPPFVPDHRIQHVTPVNDLREHAHDARGKCWCHPIIEPTDSGWLVIHNSLDGREYFETGWRQPS